MTNKTKKQPRINPGDSSHEIIKTLFFVFFNLIEVMITGRNQEMPHGIEMQSHLNIFSNLKFQS